MDQMDSVSMEGVPPLPTFESIQAALPRPILPEGSAWEPLYWFAWENLFNALKQPPKSSGLTTPYLASDTHQSLFMWDTALASMVGIFARRGFPLYKLSDNFYQSQHADGFICREIDVESGENKFQPFEPSSTGPNLFAWSEWRYFRATGDTERLNWVFPKLLAFYRWQRANRSWQNGLYWASGMSSGLDGQRRIPDGEAHHQHWSWIGASMIAALNAMLLQRMALVLEDEVLAKELGLDRQRLHRSLRSISWNPETSFFHDTDRDGRFGEAKSILAYWGLYDKDLMTDMQRQAMVAHLSDDALFATPYSIPSLSQDAAHYDPKGGHWRGAVWAPTNYMVFRGLRRNGFDLLAHQLASKHLNQIARVWQQTGTLWENYSPTEARPGDPANPDAWGWNALSACAILLEDVIGLWADWPQKTVFWNRFIETDAYYGVHQYPYGPKHAFDLMSDGKVIRITTPIPFTLRINTRQTRMKTAVPAGTSEFPII